jgi:hypothetical protein
MHQVLEWGEKILVGDTVVEKIVQAQEQAATGILGGILDRFDSDKDRRGGGIQACGREAEDTQAKD